MLGLKPGASNFQIREAYLKLARQHHPDKGGDVQQFQKITDAYQRITSDIEEQKANTRQLTERGERALELARLARRYLAGPLSNTVPGSDLERMIHHTAIMARQIITEEFDRALSDESLGSTRLNTQEPRGWGSDVLTLNPLLQPLMFGGALSYLLAMNPTHHRTRMEMPARLAMNSEPYFQAPLPFTTTNNEAIPRPPVKLYSENHQRLLDSGFDMDQVPDKLTCPISAQIFTNPLENKEKGVEPTEKENLTQWVN